MVIDTIISKLGLKKPDIQLKFVSGLVERIEDGIIELPGRALLDGKQSYKGVYLIINNGDNKYKLEYPFELSSYNKRFLVNSNIDYILTKTSQSDDKGRKTLKLEYELKYYKDDNKFWELLREIYRIVD